MFEHLCGLLVSCREQERGTERLENTRTRIRLDVGTSLPLQWQPRNANEEIQFSARSKRPS